MSRSGYSDNLEPWDLIRWRGAVKAALRGKRGQAFLRELLAALDSLPEKRLIECALVCADGVCALGAVAVKRGLDVSDVDTYDSEQMSETFGIAEAMAAEIMYENDWRHSRTPEARFEYVRKWVVENISVTDTEIEAAEALGK